MGRSRGGLTTKIHALVDGRGLPIQLHLSEGQASDCREAEARDCQDFRVWAGIMGKKESHYVPTQRTCDPV